MLDLLCEGLPTILISPLVKILGAPMQRRYIVFAYVSLSPMPPIHVLYPVRKKSSYVPDGERRISWPLVQKYHVTPQLQWWYCQRWKIFIPAPLRYFQSGPSINSRGRIICYDFWIIRTHLMCSTIFQFCYFFLIKWEVADIEYSFQDWSSAALKRLIELTHPFHDIFFTPVKYHSYIDGKWPN